MKVQTKLNELKEILSINETEEVYAKLGIFLSSQKTTFAEIYFREDCLEYLLNLGIEPNMSVEIMEFIRKGTWKRYDNKIDLPEAFNVWASCKLKKYF